MTVITKDKGGIKGMGEYREKKVRKEEIVKGRSAFKKESNKKTGNKETQSVFPRDTNVNG